jgi:hypothetical protein
MSATPQMIEFEAAYIRDDMAKRKEPYQRPYDFLYTGRAPAVGQRTETQLSPPAGVVHAFGDCDGSGRIADL